MPALPRLLSWVLFAGAVGVLLLSCTDGPSGLAQPVPGRFAVAPRFASSAAGIVDIDRVRFLVVRDTDGNTAKDTTVTLGQDGDSVDLSLSVLLLQPDETFTLTLALITPAGDTAFRAGPVTVQPSAGNGPIPVASAEFVYTGVGANAATVEIVALPANPIVAGATAPVAAVALDAAGTPIPGTPIAWTSLDVGIATVPDPGDGTVLAGTQRGSARIVAGLLTGPADTGSVSVTLPPAAIVAESGSGQSGQVTNLLPNPLVARVTASDGVGVPGVTVTFAVATGGGSLSGASAVTDANGRASVQWTLGPNVGPQTVTARTTTLPGVSATFTATGTSSGAGSVMVFAGDGQAAMVGTAVPVAPAVIVRDIQNNPVAGTTVTFAVTQGGGAVTGGTATTNGQGVAAVGSWTLGPQVGGNLLTATVTGLNPVVFTALGSGVNGAFAIAISAGDGQSATVGTAVPIAPEVTVRDTANNVLAGVPITFTVTSGGGAVTGGTPVTGAGGTAQVGGWTLGPLPGANSLGATSSGLPTVGFTATGTVGAPASIVIISGDNQTADAGTQLPLPLVVEVQDAQGNPVPGVAVTFATLQGSLVPPSVTTDAAGRAQSAWTLGRNAVNQTATAAVTGVTPAVFTATANFPNPTILLALATGGNRIVTGGSETLDVTLTAPAPAGGVTVSVTSDVPGIISVQAPGTVVIAQGGTTGQIQLNGVGGGSTTIRATATGYANGAVVLIASVQVLSLPAALNVPFGGTASLPLQISAPAPPGGVDVTLVSDNPSAVSLVTPTVTIPAGSQTAGATVAGVFPGLATITGTTAAFGNATSRVSTTANLDIVQASATINASFGQTLTVRLESGGSPVAAPPPGITVTMAARDPACVASTSPITIPTGLVNSTTAIAHAGGTTPPCTTFLVATAPNIAPDSLSVTVNPQPALTPGATTNTGSGLQRIQFGSLGASNHGGTTVRVTSSDPTIALVSPDATTPGTAFIDIPIPVNGTSFNYYVQGLENQTGTVTITASAPGFTNGTVSAAVVQPTVIMIGLGTSTTTLSPNDPFQVLIGIPNAANTAFSVEEEIRAGGTTVTATINNGTAAVAELVTSAGTSQSATVTLAPGQSRSPSTVATGGVEFQPLSGGSTAVATTIPGFVLIPAASVGVTVATPALGLSATTNTGSGLQRIQFGSLGASNHGGATVRVTSSDPTIAQVSPNATTPGTAFIDIPIPVNGTSFSYYVQGLENQTGTVTITATEPRFTTATTSATVVQPTVIMIGLGTSTTTLSPNDPFQVLIGIPNAANTAFSVEEEIRAGGTTVTATINNGTAAVAELVTSAGTSQSATVTLAPGQSRSPSTVATGGVEFRPLTAAATATTVSATIPGYVVLPAASVDVTVMTPALGLSTTINTGSGLQRIQFGSLGASNHGGTTVRITSSSAGVALVSPNASTPGAAFIDIPIPVNGTGFSYYVQGVEGATGTVTLTATAPGFTDGINSATVVQPAVDIIGLVSTISASAANDVFLVRIGVPDATNSGIAVEEELRAGASAITATVTNSNATVAQLLAAASGQLVTVNIGAGQSRSGNTAAQGGVEFDPLAPGSTTVAAMIPGFIILPGASQVVTVQ